MTHASEPASVRDARMAAKKMSREGAATYQQALDAVARERGHRNWSDLLRAEAPRDPGAIPKGGAAPTRKRAMDIAETQVLEDATSRHSLRSHLPTTLSEPLSAAANIWIFSVALVGWHTLTAAAVAFLLVAMAGFAARHSAGGLVRVRHAIREKVVPAFMVVMGIGIAALLYALLTKGLTAIVDTTSFTPGGWRTTWDHPWMPVVYMVGLTGYYTSTRMHRAMVLARPDTVRPERMGDVHVPAAPAIASPAVARLLRTATYGGLATSFAGLAGLAWTVVGVIGDGGVDMPLLGTSLGLITVGAVVAAISSFGMDADKPIPARRIEDPSRRAARARRFLGGRRAAAR